MVHSIFRLAYMRCEVCVRWWCVCAFCSNKDIVRIDGSVTNIDREAVLEAFEAGRARFLLLSLKAGGVGLNLKTASYLILLDPWWVSLCRSPLLGSRRPQLALV